MSDSLTMTYTLTARDRRLIAMSRDLYNHRFNRGPVPTLRLATLEECKDFFMCSFRGDLEHLEDKTFATLELADLEHLWPEPLWIE